MPDFQANLFFRKVSRLLLISGTAQRAQLSGLAFCRLG